MKSYTDIEQSKKLAKILPLESADMYYFDNIPYCKYTGEDRDYWYTSPDYIPAWSLTALLGLIPKFSLEKDVSNNEGYQLHYNYNTTYYDEPVDAAFQMIVWLKEN